MSKQDLLGAIDADRKEHIEFLQRFVQAPSPNPPGSTVEAADVLVKYLQRHEIESEILAPNMSMPNVVSEFAGKTINGPRVLMNGHIDVFPVGDGPQWKHDPWSGINDGKFIHGRGVVDMKMGTAASVVAYAYLYKFRAYLKGSLALTAVSEEETGGRWGTRWLLDDGGEKSRWRGDCMINAEPGGLQSIRYGEKGTLRLTFTIRTIGAHGAYLHLSEGANRIAARLVHDLLSIEEIAVPNIPPLLIEELKRPEVRSVIDEMMGSGAADLVLKPTVNIGILHGGVKVNMIPDSCVMEADIRLPIGLTRDTVLHHIQLILMKFPEVEMIVQEAASNPASYSSPDHPLLAKIAAGAEEVNGRKPVGIPSLGASDSKHYRYRGIPAFIYGASPVTMASRDERGSIDEFMSVIKVHVPAIWDYLLAPL